MSLPFVVAAEPVQLRAAGTLWLPQYSALVVADLHLEKGSAYAVGGQLLPPYDTRETLARLKAEVEAVQPERLVLLGDSLHDMNALSRISEDDSHAVRALADQLELVWITGNHDPDGGSTFGGMTLDALQLGSLNLRHEPVYGEAAGEVAGHLHPCAKILGVGGSVRRRCFVSDGHRLILPAFGAYTGGLNVLDAAYNGLFAQAPFAFVTGQKVVRLPYDKLSPDRLVRRRA